MTNEDFCLTHGRDFMKSDRGPIPYCARCDAPQDTAADLRAFSASIKTSCVDPSLVDRLEGAATDIDRLTQALAMANTGGLSLIYDIRKALGWSQYHSLDLLPDGVRALRKTLTQIRAFFADKLAYYEDLKARGDLTKDWGEAGHTSTLLSLTEIDLICAVNNVRDIKPTVTP